MNIKELLALLKSPVEPETPEVEMVSIPKEEYDAFIELQALIETKQIEEPVKVKPIEEKPPVEQPESELVKIKKEMEALRATIAKKTVTEPVTKEQTEGVFTSSTPDDIELASFLNNI